ncbi:MAG TPA: hypothetical protein VKB86_01095, partial [Pyrinomonadaceae bacterium]|nr:hypothetical protein [Pyrinomonadaceae bacterium]
LAVVVFAASVFFVGAQTRTSAPARTAAPSSISALNLLPASDVVVSINLKRLLNEALPKFFADNPAKLAQFNAQIDKIKTQTGIDVRSFEDVAVGLRYQNRSPEVRTTGMVMIAHGTFDAGALLAAGRVAAQGKYHEEKYNGSTIYVFTLPEQVDALPGPLSVKIKELAVASLGSNALVLGEPQSVRTALDANRTPQRAGNAIAELATRAPDALIGFGANVPPSLTAKADFGNPEITKIIASIRQAYGAVNSTTNGFGLQAIARTETPEQAKTLGDTLVALKQFGAMVIPQLPVETRQIAQETLDSLKITASGNETALNVEISQANISTLMRGMKK